MIKKSINKYIGNLNLTLGQEMSVRLCRDFLKGLNTANLGLDTLAEEENFAGHDLFPLLATSLRHSLWRARVYEAAFKNEVSDCWEEIFPLLASLAHFLHGRHVHFQYIVPHVPPSCLLTKKVGTIDALKKICLLLPLHILDSLPHGGNIKLEWGSEIIVKINAFTLDKISWGEEKRQEPRAFIPLLISSLATQAQAQLRWVGTETAGEVRMTFQ